MATPQDDGARFAALVNTLTRQGTTVSVNLCAVCGHQSHPAHQPWGPQCPQCECLETDRTTFNVRVPFEDYETHRFASIRAMRKWKRTRGIAP